MASRPEIGKLKLRPGDVDLTVAQLRLTPLFANASDVVARRLGSLRTKGAVVLRRYAAGEVVCRQGEAGFTAFYIMRDADIRRVGIAPLPRSDGDPSSLGPGSVGVPSVTIDQLLLSEAQGNRVKVQVSILPARTVRPPKPGPMLERLRDRLVRIRRKKVIPFEGSANVVAAEDGPLVGHLREGELFGEMSCFSHSARAATIRTTEDCYMLELMRNVLEDALENEAFRSALDHLYRKRVLETHLASMPIFEDAPPEVMDELERRAELVTHESGAIVFREGDPPDAMYFIRLGTVKMSRGGGGRVIAYRSRGEWVGAGSMLAGEKRLTTCVVHEPGPQRSAEERSQGSKMVGRAELVRVSRELFADVSAMHPALRGKARHLVEHRSHVSKEPQASAAVENLAGSLGLLQAEKLMLIDLDRCTRCDDCVRACADTHDGIPLMQRSGPRFGSYLIPDTCRQCLDPVCLLGCPVGSIHRGKGGEIVIEDWCIGCGLCAEQCPYDAISMTEGAHRKAHACDQCASLGSGEPMCVYACSHDAAIRVDGRSFFTEWSERKR